MTCQNIQAPIKEKKKDVKKKIRRSKKIKNRLRDGRNPSFKKGTDSNTRL